MCHKIEHFVTLRFVKPKMSPATEDSTTGPAKQEEMNSIRYGATGAKNDDDEYVITVGS